MGGKILVVDDVATNRIVLKAKLALACHDVVQAETGPEALAQARRERPDVILLDDTMPGMGGLAVLEALRSDPATAAIPVIVVSARAARRTRLAALRAGAEDVMVKPIDDAALAARLRALTRNRALTEQLELRDGTRTALGFAEPPAPLDWAGDPAPPAEVALLGRDGAETEAWAAALSARLPHRFLPLDRVEALRRLPRAEPSGPEADSRAPPVPDAFVIAVDLTEPGGGLRLLSELRANPRTRHAAILVSLIGSDQRLGPTALDLGASDLVAGPLDADELALRLDNQLRRASADETMRRRVRDGLQMAVTDPLTGLANRRYALAHIAQVAARPGARETGLAVLALDLDRFKAVNDAHGHAGGDAVLRAVAERLQHELRAVDLLARIGGEEFLAVLPDTPAPGARKMAERLRSALADRPIPLPGGGDLWQTVSIGIALSPRQAPPDTPALAKAAAEELIAAADRALYHAKAAGRNRSYGPLPPQSADDGDRAVRESSQGAGTGAAAGKGSAGRTGNCAAA